MNTPAHLIVGLAAFSKPHATAVTVAALAGAFMPDASLYFMAGVALFVFNISPDNVFGTLYFSDAWQQVFAIDNSFVLWGLGLAGAIWKRSPWAVAFTGAALLHIALDFPFHAEDARMHFWPLSTWKFHSPISYWDSGQGGGWFAPLEMIFVIILTAWVIRRIPDLWVRCTAVLLCALQVVPVLSWYLFF